MVEGETGFLKQTVKALADEARDGRHPSHDEIVAYCLGTLPEQQQESLQDHLAICPSCAKLLLDLQELATGERGHDQAEITPDSKERMFQSTWGAVEEGSDADRASAPRPRHRPSVTSSLTIAYAIAASLLLAALGTWVAQLRGTVADLSRPRRNVVVSNLAPLTEMHRDEGAAKKLTIPEDADGLLLILNLADLRSFQKYGVELIDEHGAVSWTDDRLTRGISENFTLQFPRGFVPAGLYHLSLFGLDDGKREILAEYSIRIDYQ